MQAVPQERASGRCYTNVWRPTSRFHDYNATATHSVAGMPCLCTSLTDWHWHCADAWQAAQIMHGSKLGLQQGLLGLWEHLMSQPASLCALAVG
jgi:hypothetical protein